MIKSSRSALVAAVFLMSCSGAFAAFINFVEATLEGDPVVVATNIVLTAPSVITAESARVTGFHHPGISPSPIATPPGKRAAALFEPGNQDLVSDYVLLTVGEIRPDAVFGLAQDLLVEFFSVDISLADFRVFLANGGFTFGGGLVEDGTLQNLSALLGTLPEGLIVRAQSGPGELPEPGSVALVGLGLMAFAIIRRRKALT